MSAREASVGIIGSGTAGLITAYTLIQDGFTSVQVLTRDEAAGGVWAAKRIYPGLILNKQVSLFIAKGLHNVSKLQCSR